MNGYECNGTYIFPSLNDLCRWDVKHNQPSNHHIFS